jgi:hypothetical protein
MKNKNEGRKKKDESPQIFNVFKDIRKIKFDRREFIETASIATTAILLTGCSQAKEEIKGIVKTTTTTLYSGPGYNYIRIGNIQKGKSVTLNGKNSSGSWFRVNAEKNIITALSSGYTDPIIIGWLYKTAVDLKKESTNALKVYSPPPTPQPTAKPTPKPTSTPRPGTSPTKRPTTRGGTICTCNKVSYWYPN